MTPEEAAEATTGAVSALASHFMVDPGTYAMAAELGFEGMDFYTAGRGGVLGDVPGESVAAAFVFFEPGGVTTMWERARLVMAPAESGQRWIDACHAWAEARLPDDVDLARLADLAGRVVANADAAGAPIFAAWRVQPEPESGRVKALALHRMNALRELRMAMHGAAVVTSEVTPLEALTIRTPYMVPVFGWPEGASDVDAKRPQWQEAEHATNRAFGRALAVLDEDERDEFARLAGETQAAVTS